MTQIAGGLCNNSSTLAYVQPAPINTAYVHTADLFEVVDGPRCPNHRTLLKLAHVGHLGRSQRSQRPEQDLGQIDSTDSQWSWQFINTHIFMWLCACVGVQSINYITHRPTTCLSNCHLTLLHQGQWRQIIHQEDWLNKKIPVVTH